VLKVSPPIGDLVPTCESSRNPLPGGRGSDVVAEPRAQASGRASRTVANFCKLVLAREVCQRTFSAAIMEGSVARLGSKYVLGLRTTNCRTGEIIDDEQAQTSRKEDVLNVLGPLASKFRTRAGESLATINEHAIPCDAA
jgi:hypothetical protein